MSVMKYKDPTTGEIKKVGAPKVSTYTPFKPAGKSYLTFSSPNSFTLAAETATKYWAGTLEYFASDRTWTTWDGATTLSSADNDGEYVLYLRGTGNTVITGNDSNYRWVLTGSNIKCIGNIENLLDYATVESGSHPTMSGYCYASMFSQCSSLTQAPALHATTLVEGCYNSMFDGCTALTQAPALPATTLASYCYQSMFFRCTSLTQAPALPATTLAGYCYSNMFYGCTSLKLSTIQTGEYTVAYRIPTTGTGTTVSSALTDMFVSTGGTFTGTPEINTTYYLSSDNMIVRETEIATLNGYVGSMIDDIAQTLQNKADLGEDGKVPENQLPEISAVKTFTATIGTTWTENEDTGVKSQNVSIPGVLAKHTAKVDHAYTGSGTSDDYASFVEAENQYLTYITNGYAETYDGGITFYIFGDAPTVSIPIVVEVA